MDGVRRVLLGIALLALAAWVLQVLRGRLVVVRVAGSSMAPTFVDGERVVARRIGRGVVLRADDVVVVEHAAGPGGDADHVIKRIRAMAGDDVPGRPGERVPDEHVWVEGDGVSSYDSRHFGPVPERQVRGVVRRSRT